MEEKNKISTPIAIVLAGFMIMVGIIVSKTPTNTTKSINTEQIAQESFELEGVSEKDHIRGDINKAEAVIIEYSDTECPFCKDFHNIALKAMDQYGEKVAWVYRHFPIDSLHKKARKEAEATECVNKIGGNDAFWSYLDMIFEATPSNDGLDESLLPIFAERLGLNVNEFNSCLNSGEFSDFIQESFDNGVKAGVRGTPYSVVITKDGTQIPVQGANEKRLFEVLNSAIR